MKVFGAAVALSIRLAAARGELAVLVSARKGYFDQNMYAKLVEIFQLTSKAFKAFICSILNL